MSNPIVRTTDNQYYEGVINPAWGGYWVETEPANPQMDNVDPAEVRGFELVPDFPKLPAELWTAIIKLYRATCNGVDGQTQLETSVRLLRSQDGSEWKVVVPRQTVTGASVRAENFNDCIDLISGEEYEQYPPAGWVNAGSSHSHDVLDAFFSSTDNAFELSDPGMHVVVGNINVRNKTHTPLASIVQRYKRYIVPTEDVIDTTELESVTFHPRVLTYISTYSREGSIDYLAAQLERLLNQ